jgi:hypothetical protein
MPLKHVVSYYIVACGRGAGLVPREVARMDPFEFGVSSLRIDKLGNKLRPKTQGPITP